MKKATGEGKFVAMSVARVSIGAIGARFRRLVRAFDVHPAFKRFSTSPSWFGDPYVEQNGDTYAYLVSERGTEYERRETNDPDELLYWLVSHTTAEAAQQFELAHRVPGKDSRRIWFAKHVELMENIRSDWGSRTREEYENVLKEAPYDDSLHQQG
jgi:hypothetical protein